MKAEQLVHQSSNSAAAAQVGSRAAGRAGSAAQLRQAALAESSARAAQLRSLAGSIEAAGGAQLSALEGATAQRAEDEEEPLQGRWADAAPAQLAAEEEEPLQGRWAGAAPAQLAADEEDPLQGHWAGQPAQLATEEEEPAQMKAEPNRTGLPDNLKSGVESLSGMSLDNVRVHYNSPQPAQLNAHAYAQGTDIHVAPGQEQHLPHEAWHVVQQAEGRVQPTTEVDGVAVNDDHSLESEADAMGARALSGA
ncbi:DUF4157 domain-containing protein [Derxia gummosa]|uniref:DUF4157 domain-containing protein n=1 Tax=Derxia gummosa DSM 723 TaxID=1121388 RepID=A0A9U5D2T5_9BURK|nr:DUF4157 domain-containing protein [Derxia gummosa]